MADLQPTTRSPLITFIARWARPLLAIYWPLLIFATHKRPPIKIVNFEIRDVPPDKLLHTAVFVLLTILLIYSIPLTRKFSQTANIIAATLIAAAFAYVDEYTQRYVGRSVSVWDMVANLTGITAAMAAMTYSCLNRPDRTPITFRLILIIFAPIAAILLLTHGLDRQLILFFNRDPQQLLHAPGLTRPDRVAHIILAFLVFLALMAARPLGVRRLWLNFICITLTVAAAAYIIEIIQKRFGRGYEQWDIIAHELGLAIAIVTWIVYKSIRYLIDHKINSPTEPEMDTSQSNPDPHSSEISIDTAVSPPAFVSNALTVSILTLVSRFLGLLRDTAIAYAFGLSSVTNAFYFGFMIPNLFRRLFGEGALTAAFIPVYTDTLKTDPNIARRLASAATALLIIFLSILTILGELTLAFLNARTWTDDTHLAIRLTMIMLPYMPMICLVALFAGILNVHRRFAVPASMPIILNLTLIAATLFATSRVFGQQPLITVIPIVAAAVLVAGIIQLVYQTAALLRVESFTFNFTGTATHLRLIIATMIPMLLGLAVIQINTFFDGMIAFSLAPKQDGQPTFQLLGYTLQYPIQANSITAINWAQRLYQFPLGVFGIALATAIFPALASAAAPEPGQPQNLDNFRTILRQGIRLTFFIGLPASVGLIIIRLPLTRLIFEYGQTDLLQTVQVATLLVGYASGVWAYSMIHTLTRGFYALKDATTPLKISCAMVIINLVLNLTLIWPLGASGLAWSTAICAMLQVALLLMAMRQYLDKLFDIAALKSIGTTICLTVLMASALEPLVSYYNPAQLSRSQSAILLATVVILGIAIFTLGAWKFNADELNWLIKRKQSK